ncbi:putative non-specific serine/threonine protein kinase [Helianthus anomalus]
MAGRGSLAGLLPFADANAIVFEMANEVLPVTGYSSSRKTRRDQWTNRPNGEHNLVEWARPYLGERRRFYKLIDPRLEGRFSKRGAHKAAQLATLCLSHELKARPLMSEVHEALKPLPTLKDMACASPYF